MTRNHGNAHMETKRNTGRGPAAIGEEVRRRERFDPTASAGLFVGVSRFDDRRFAEVPFAVDDAVDLAHLFTFELGLIEPGRVVLALAGEVRKPETRSRLEELSGAGVRRAQAHLTTVYRSLAQLRAESGPEGLLVVAVATHGFSDQGGDYLIAADSLLERPEHTGVKVEVLFDDVARAVSPRRLVLLDACRERLTQGTRGRGASRMTESFAEAITGALGQVVLSGATLGGFAYDDEERGNGVFTAAVLDGLRGQATADENGFITVRSLGDFVQRRVVQWVRRFRPEDAGQSLGIGQRLEGAAADLPLAVDPEHSRAAEQYRVRREEALLRLKDNLGRVLTGALYDEVMGLLPAGGTGAGADELLAEIEALDGGVRSQRSFRDYLRERRKAAAPDERADPVGRGSDERTGTVTAEEASEPVPTPRRQGGSAARAGRSAWRKAGVRFWPVVGGAAVALVVLFVVGMVWIGGFGESPPPYGTAPGSSGSEGLQDDSASTAFLDWPARPEAGTAAAGPLDMRFRFVPAGNYWIGSPEEEAGRFDSETRHRVRLNHGFWLSETEVTQRQWQELIPENPSNFQTCGADCPVEAVNWYDAVTYANLLSEHAGLDPCYELSGCSGRPGRDGYACGQVSFSGLDCPGFRLPTEAEWEVAARAGTETAIYTGKLTIRGTSGPALDPIAWYGGNSDGSSHPVGRKDSNAWGFHDMLGNVYEWVWDRWGEYHAGPVIDPTGPEEGSSLVIRGGSWASGARYVRAAYRSGIAPSRRWGSLGFRLARGQVSAQEGRSPGQGAPGIE